jgi:hypothetical protein
MAGGRGGMPGRAWAPGAAGRVGAGGDTCGRIAGRGGTGRAAGASPVTGSSIRNRRVGGTTRDGRRNSGLAAAGGAGRAGTDGSAAASPAAAAGVTAGTVSD